MLFSVMIPVYNVQKYIRECIESVLTQTEQDYEIILVDDGSTDESGIICDEYAQAHPDKIRVIHQENKGLLMTRRIAIQVAQGDYYIFLDSDDTLRRNALELIKRTIHEKQCDMVMFGFVRIGLEGERTENVLPYDGQVFEDETKIELYRLIIASNRINNIWIKAVHKSNVDRKTDYTHWAGVSIGEDILQSLPLITYAKRIAYLGEALYNYRKNQGSMTLQKSFNLYDSSRVVLIELKRYMSIWGIEKELSYSFDAKYMNMCFNCVSTACEVTQTRIERKRLDALIMTISKDSLFLACSKSAIRMLLLNRIRYRLIAGNHSVCIYYFLKALHMLRYTRKRHK